VITLRSSRNARTNALLVTPLVEWNREPSNLISWIQQSPTGGLLQSFGARFDLFHDLMLRGDDERHGTAVLSASVRNM
jgi:hypothetical protein